MQLLVRTMQIHALLNDAIPDSDMLLILVFPV